MVVIKDEIHRNKKTIMFDIDGTLVYFDNMDKLVREALSLYGYFIKDYAKKNQAGVINLLRKSENNKKYFSLENYIIEQQNSMGLSPDDAHLVVKKMLELAPKYTKVYPGVKENIHSLSQHLICVTDWFKEAQLNKLRIKGIEYFFEKFDTCEGNYTKYNPERFVSILKKEGIDKQQCVMVGDSLADLVASRVGIDTILMDYEGNKGELYNRADAVITEFSDIKKILRRK